MEVHYLAYTTFVTQSQYVFHYVTIKVERHAMFKYMNNSDLKNSLRLLFILVSFQYSQHNLFPFSCKMNMFTSIVLLINKYIQKINNRYKSTNTKYRKFKRNDFVNQQITKYENVIRYCYKKLDKTRKKSRNDLQFMLCDWIAVSMNQQWNNVYT